VYIFECHSLDDNLGNDENEPIDYVMKDNVRVSVKEWWSTVEELIIAELGKHLIESAVEEISDNRKSVAENFQSSLFDDSSSPYAAEG
jgi:hypothetical protein